jgi:hypothetical protein
VLELQPGKTGKHRPRLWWCPTGHFAHLPIHAANVKGVSCSDYFVSSYIPTLRTLIDARDGFIGTSKSDIKILLGAVPRPYSAEWHHLPSTVVEVQNITHIAPAACLPIPEGEDARLDADRGMTVQTLLQSLPNTTILHLASHGVRDANDPLAGGFIMHDGPLTISDLMAIPAPKAFLAFLSACNTAMSDKVRASSFYRCDKETHSSTASARPDGAFSQSYALCRLQECRCHFMVWRC